MTFTGSGAVGLKIKEKVGLRKITLELGSNAALIVEPSTPLEKIMKRGVGGAFGFAGQVCISLQRIYVHTSIYDAFTKLFVEETKKLAVGDPHDEKTDVSAMIHPDEVSRIKTGLKRRNSKVQRLQQELNLQSAHALQRS